MKLGIVTDSLSTYSFEDMLDACVRLGISEVEFPTGGWSTAPHCNVRTLLDDASELGKFRAAVEDRGLRISALNANGNQLHPVIGGEVDKVLKDTVELARRLEVPTVVCMSGLPGGATDEKTPNWVTTSWPPETQDILEYQWNEVALPYWSEMAEFGKSRGVRFAIEMHGNQLVYSGATLLKLRSEIGDQIGANFDPSHPMWMGADPRALVRELGDAIYHVHAKDARIQDHVADVNGRLDTQPPTAHQDRAWNYVTLGLGYPGGSQFWGQLLTDLRSYGYDGVLSIEHEDVLLDALEGVTQTVELLSSVLPVAAPSWKPAAI